MGSHVIPLWTQTNAARQPVTPMRVGLRLSEVSVDSCEKGVRTSTGTVKRENLKTPYHSLMPNGGTAYKFALVFPSGQL